MNINEIGQHAHENAKAKGFYDVPPTIPMRLLLIHSEISEACEAHRKGQLSKESADMDCPDEYFVAYYETNFKGKFWDEIADVVIRCADFAASEGARLEIYKCGPADSVDLAGSMNYLHDIISQASAAFNRENSQFAFEWITNAVSACFDMARIEGVDLESHIIAKMRYNAMRPHKHGGKAY